MYAGRQAQVSNQHAQIIYNNITHACYPVHARAWVQGEYGRTCIMRVIVYDGTQDAMERRCKMVLRTHGLRSSSEMARKVKTTAGAGAVLAAVVDYQRTTGTLENVNRSMKCRSCWLSMHLLAFFADAQDIRWYAHSLTRNV